MTVLIITYMGVQVPTLGKLEGVLEHLFGVRLEDELLTQSECGVVVVTL